MQVTNIKGKANQLITSNCAISYKSRTGETVTPPLGKMFQSYKSNIAFKCSGGVFLDEKYWDYSATTSKYRNIFLGETTKETKAKIKSGEYKLVDLN